MKVAIPVVGGQVARHFGHCDEFALFDVDTESAAIIESGAVAAPAHEPGLLPEWLSQLGVELVIAGGMGRRAQQLFAQAGIQVIAGALPGDAQTAVEAYLSGALQTGSNPCDH